MGDKTKEFFLFLIFFIFLVLTLNFINAEDAFNFAGYTKYSNATNMTYVNVTIEVYQFSEGGPPTLITSLSNLSDSNGVFNLTVNSTYSNLSYNYKPVLVRYNGTTGNGTYATYIGQSLPEFGYQEISQLSSSAITFYLKQAITIDLSAIGREHAAGTLSDLSNVSFPTNHRAGLELINLSGYSNGEFWAYVNSSDCLFVLNSSYSVNMSFCELNITNITDLTFTNSINSEARFYLLNATKVELCNLTLASGSINCTINYNITHTDFSTVLGIEYVSANSLFYISGINGTNSHWMHRYNITFSNNIDTNRSDRPDYSAGKILYLNNYLYTVTNRSGTGWIIYRCSIGAGEVCEDYSTFKSTELNITGIAYNFSNGRWYYSSYTNNSIVRFTPPFTIGFNFFYQVKDIALGYPVKETFSSGGSGVSSSIFYLPIDRNYSMMVYPNNGPAFPAKIDFNGLGNNGTNVSLGGTVAGGRNATITMLNDGSLYLNLSQANMTTEFVRLSGYVNWTTGTEQNFSSFTIITYLIEGGNMVFKGATLPQNMGQWQYPQITDVFNASTGFYNMTLPASVLGANLMLFAVTKVNQSGAISSYGCFKTVLLNYGETPSQTNLTVYPLIGEFSNLTLGFEGQSSANNLNTTLKEFKLQNKTGTVVSQGHVEVELEYPVSQFPGSNISFSWMGDLSSASNGSIKFPLLNYSVKKIKVFSSQYAPRQKALSLTELLGNPVYFNLSNFENVDPDSGQAFSDIEMMMYINKDDGSCSVPNPLTECFPFSDAMEDEDFNPFSMVIGGGKLDFEMKKTSNNITVRYINVNLLASGPPDAMFDSSASSGTSGNTMEEVWKFGSEGPEIYDYVLIATPYTEGSSSLTGINESAEIRINITKLYGESFSTYWEQGTNSTDNLSGTDYEDFTSGNYLNYLNGTGILCNSSDENLSSGLCYKDTTQNLLWFKIPHFSGVGPEITGSLITATTVTSATTTDSSGGSSSGLSFWKYTYAEDDKELKDKGAIIKELGLKNRIRIKVNNETHSVGVIEISNSTIKINISSEPQIATLSVGDFRRFEITGDNYYDVGIMLNSINLTSLKANITLNAISEKVTPQTIEEEQNKEKLATAGSFDEENVFHKIPWWWYIVGGVIIVMIFLILFTKTKNIEKNNFKNLFLVI